MLGMVAGMALGLVQDFATGSFYGMHGLVGTILGYVAARVSQQISLQGPLLVGLTFTLASALHQGLLIALQILILGPGEAFGVAVPSTPLVMMKSVGCGGVAVLLWWIARRFERRRKRAKTARPNKVKLD